MSYTPTPDFPEFPSHELGELAGAVAHTQEDLPMQLEAWREFVIEYPDLARLALKHANELDESLTPRQAFLNGIEYSFLLRRQRQRAMELGVQLGLVNYDGIEATVPHNQSPHKRPRMHRLGYILSTIFAPLALPASSAKNRKPYNHL